MMTEVGYPVSLGVSLKFLTPKSQTLMGLKRGVLETNLEAPKPMIPLNHCHPVGATKLS